MVISRVGHARLASHVCNAVAREGQLRPVALWVSGSTNVSTNVSHTFLSKTSTTPIQSACVYLELSKNKSMEE